MRVCQPGPVARQRFTTSGGRRREMSWRGFGERGRPPLLTMARLNISSVSSGSSLYSERRMRCASTRFRSEPKVRREAVLLTSIGLSHAEDVAIRATRGVADDDQASFKLALAEHPNLAIVLARALDLDGQAGVRRVDTNYTSIETKGANRLGAQAGSAIKRLRECSRWLRELNKQVLA
jgi:hypothetical protein